MALIDDKVALARRRDMAARVKEVMADLRPGGERITQQYAQLSDSISAHREVLLKTVQKNRLKHR